MTRNRVISAVLAMVLVACGEEDVILPGERVDIREGLRDQVNQTRPIALPVARANVDWTHRNGGPDHQISHPALGGALSPLFAVEIGAGNSRRARITADPVVAGGVVYTLDASSTLVATSTAGARLWSRNLTPPLDNVADASGGGVSVAGGRVYVTTGFGEVTALDAASGAVIWVQDLDAPGTSAPTVFGDLVYVVSRDSTAWALEVGNGRVRWQLSGDPSVANFAGGAGPAVNDDVAVFPFPSGEVLATFPEGGLRRWDSVVSGERLGRAANIVSDIAGDPVIDGDRVYVGNFEGRIAALDTANGERIWTARDGATSPVWPVGDSIFAVNDLGELVRLDAADGTAIWRVPLPRFEDEGNSRAKRLFVHYGPVLAGGRLIVASSDGVIRQFNPTNGALIGSVDVPGGAASNPVVAGGTLYVVSTAGQLHAFR